MNSFLDAALIVTVVLVAMCIVDLLMEWRRR